MNKNKWISLLENNLIHFPSEGIEYQSCKDIIVTIVAKKKVRKRSFTFGGPVWSATLFFYSNELNLSYFSPIKKPHYIKYNEIVEINFKHLL